MKKIITFVLILLLTITILFLGVTIKSNNKKTPSLQSLQTVKTSENTSTPHNEKFILSPYNVSFAIPDYLRVSANNYYPYVTSLDTINAFSKDSKGDRASDASITGIKVVYSVVRPWTPNIYNIPFGNAFNGTGKTTQLNSDSLLQERAYLSPNQVTMYTYLLGDDEGHNRGKYGSVYQGDVRLDFETPDHII